jgi:hypothetical protein
VGRENTFGNGIFTHKFLLSQKIRGVSIAKLTINVSFQNYEGVARKFEV